MTIPKAPVRTDHCHAAARSLLQGSPGRAQSGQTCSQDENVNFLACGLGVRHCLFSALFKALAVKETGRIVTAENKQAKTMPSQVAGKITIATLLQPIQAARVHEEYTSRVKLALRLALVPFATTLRFDPVGWGYLI